MSRVYPFAAHDAHFRRTAYDIITSWGTGTDTRAEAERWIAPASEWLFLLRVDHLIVDDAFQLSIDNALRHTQNQDTLALAQKRIPVSSATEDTLRFGIAYNHEISLFFTEYVQQMKDNIIHDTDGKYRVNSAFNMTKVRDEGIYKAVDIADKIVSLMHLSRAAVGRLSQNPDFIRNAALVELGEMTGLLVATQGNPIMLGVRDSANWLHYYQMLANNSWYVQQLQGVRYPAQKQNQTDTFRITAKNGPSEVHVQHGGAAAITTVLAKDATRVFTIAEMGGSITTTPILPPTVATPIANQTVELTTTQTVNYGTTFSGRRLTYRVASSRPIVATASLSEDAGILDVRAIATGSTTITVTATNEAGSAAATFLVTVSDSTA